MASSNVNITPSDGIVEGDLFQLLLRPLDVDGAPATLSAIDIKVSKAGAVETFNLGDLSTVVIDSVSYQAVSFTVEAGLNQIQAEATGDVQAVDLAYLKATAKPLA